MKRHHNESDEYRWNRWYVATVVVLIITIAFLWWLKWRFA
jgi:hypothetical protein